MRRVIIRRQDNSQGEKETKKPVVDHHPAPKQSNASIKLKDILYWVLRLEKWYLLLFFCG